MKKKLVMYFDGMQNVHLNKDVGLVAHFISKEYDLGLEYVTADNCTFDIFRGHRISKIKRLSNNKYNIFFYLYLLKNSKKTDYLMTIHCRPYNLLIGMLYKKLNPEGKFYIKMDIGPKGIDYYNSEIQIKSNDNFIKNSIKLLKSRFRKLRFAFLIKYVDLLSIETIDVYKYIRKYGLCGSKVSDRLTLLCNGMDNERDDVKLKQYNEKENIILTVGRLGTYQKNTVFFLNVIKNLDLKNWKVVLVGPITNKFKDKINLFYSENPNLREKVIFTGNISDREKVLDYYNKAKVFCLTSRFESAAQVYAESAYFSNYIITTDVGGAKEITQNGKYGIVVSQGDMISFTEILQDIISGEIDLEEKYNMITDRRDKITWQNLIKNNKELNSIFG